MQRRLKLIDLIFDQLEAASGRWFAENYGQGERLRKTKEFWAAGKVGDLSKTMLMIGIRNLSSNARYLPDTPAKFLDLCKPSPEEMGAHPAEAAFKLAVEGIREKWDTVITLTVIELTGHSVRSDAYEKIYPKFKKTYERYLEMLAEALAKGENLDHLLPKEPLQLPPPGPTAEEIKNGREEFLKRLNQLKNN